MPGSYWAARLSIFDDECCITDGVRLKNCTYAKMQVTVSLTT